MRTLCVSLLLCIVTATVALAQETNISITIDGVTYENYHWGTITPTTVSIIHRTGAATIPLEKLPPDLQKRFGYDPKKVAESRALEQKAEAPSLGSPKPSGNSGRKDSAETLGVASMSTPRIPALIVFVNKSKDMRRIYWLDFKGERQRYMELKPGETGNQQTYLGHAWLVTDVQDNALGVYYPDGQKRVVVLE
jgi:hypothetical protein